jgi:hypothetical protein
VLMATSSPVPRLSLLRVPDVVLVLAAAPIALFLGVPIVGYLGGGTTWILLRAAGLAADSRATSLSHVVIQASVRIGYRMARIALLVSAVVLTRKVGGKADALTALLVIVTAFTIQLTGAIVQGPGPR